MYKYSHSTITRFKQRPFAAKSNFCSFCLYSLGNECFQGRRNWKGGRAGGAAAPLPFAGSGKGGKSAL